MEKPGKHGHAKAGRFWTPPEGAATVGPRPAGVLSRNIAFRHRILLFVMPFFSLYSRQSFRCDGKAENFELRNFDFGSGGAEQHLN